MDINTILWGAFLLFMLICCGMMMRMMKRPSNPPNITPQRNISQEDDTDEVRPVTMPGQEKR